MAAFEELGLLPELVQAAERAGWRYVDMFVLVKHCH